MTEVKNRLLINTHFCMYNVMPTSLQWSLSLLHYCELHTHFKISYSGFYNSLFTHIVLRQQSLLPVSPFLGDSVISVKYGWVHVQEALVQKYIHAEIYSLSLLGFFAQLNGWGCHGDLSFAFFLSLNVFILFSRLRLWTLERLADLLDGWGATV